MLNLATSSPTSFLRRLPVALAVGLINIYQHTLSPDHGWLRAWYPHGACKFHPTCSAYTKESIQRHGLITGTRLGLQRLVRCHPWSVGGYDPVT